MRQITAGFGWHLQAMVTENYEDIKGQSAVAYQKRYEY